MGFRLAALLALWWAGAVHAQSTAWVADRAESYGPSSGIFFVVLAVNDTELPDNAIRSTRRASAFRGAYIQVVGAERPVPAGKVKLKIMGSIENVAPITSLYRALFHGGSPDFTGTVEVDLKPGVRYRVNGILDDFQREAWIEEVDSRAVVSAKVVMPLDPEVAKLMEGAQFLCCNTRYSDNWSDDTPNPELPFLPAGSRAKVVDYSRNEAAVLVGGKRMRIGNQHSRAQESIRQMIARLVVAEDPRTKLMALDADTRNAIVSGKVLPGMTREQVLVALGRPRMAETPRLEADEWLYHVGTEEAFIVFGADGRVKEVDGSRKARGLMLAARQPAAADAAPNAAPNSPSPAAATAPGASAPASAPR